MSGPAAAQQCTLKLMAALPMTDTSGRFTVPVSLNGETHQFLIDTAGIYTSLTESVIQQLKLKEVPVSGTNVYDTEGKRATKGVLVDSLKLGMNEIKHVHAFVHDDGDKEIDGTLAPNLLQVFDVDLDFSGHKVNLFSQDHCPGKVVYWTKDYAEIPFKMPDGFHIVAPVALDGHNLTATFDTGSPVTFLSQQSAETVFNAGPNASGSEPVPNAKPQDRIQYQHRFQSLAFGGVSVTNPLIYLLPDDTAKAIRKDYDDPKSIDDPVYGLQLDLPRLIIGENVIKRLHVYIAYKEHVMYVTSADAH